MNKKDHQVLFIPKKEPKKSKNQKNSKSEKNSRKKNLKNSKNESQKFKNLKIPEKFQKFLQFKGHQALFIPKRTEKSNSGSKITSKMQYLANLDNLRPIRKGNYVIRPIKQSINQLIKSIK